MADGFFTDVDGNIEMDANTAVDDHDKMTTWLVRTRVKVTWSELEVVLPRHLAFEEAAAEDGTLLLAGPVPLADGSFLGDGLTFVAADTEADARAFAERDPFVREGVRDIVEVDRWDVRRVGRRVEELRTSGPGAR